MKLPLLLSCLGLGILPVAGVERHVGAGRPWSSISAALDAAAPGDRIIVHSGRFAEGELRITKPVELVGVGRPVLDGESKWGIITVSASDVIVRGFVLRRGGRSSTSDLAGIRVESAARVTLEGNEVRDCQFAIYLARARDCTVHRNLVEGVPGNEQDSGNGVHLWNCTGTRITGNSVRAHRDGIYLEFANGSTVEDNLVAGNLRYGLHFMTSHESAYRGNRFTGNGAGVAVMYSRQVTMSDNLFERSWGGSAYGLLLKDITDSRIHGNRFRRNSTAIYAQGATRVGFEGNDFQENGWALRILASGTGNTFQGNNFRGNTFDVATNGQLSEHRFARNYWDRYEGYDLNRDGRGDVPFRPVGLFTTLVERLPASVLLIRSLAMHLLDRAEKALPSIAPDGVADVEPSSRPHAIPASIPGRHFQPPQP